MKQFLSLLALCCSCAAQAQFAAPIRVGVYGRGEAVPKNDGFLGALLPAGGEVSSRATCGISFTQSYNNRWQLRFEPGISYTKYSAYQSRQYLGAGFDGTAFAPERQTIYDKNYFFALQLPVSATYYIIPRHLMLAAGLETSIGMLNYRKAAFQNFDESVDRMSQKNWLPGMYALNMPLSVGYQFRLSRKLISVEPGVNLCLTRQDSRNQNYNRYSLKLAYYF